MESKDKSIVIAFKIEPPFLKEIRGMKDDLLEQNNPQSPNYIDDCEMVKRYFNSLFYYTVFSSPKHSEMRWNQEDNENFLDYIQQLKESIEIVDIKKE